MNDFFSVIIPARNEELYIGKLLGSLTHQTYKKFEVIVIDAHSEDRTVDILNEFKHTLDLTILTTNAKNVSISRNLGAKKAKGELLFFIDADNDIKNNFLELAKKHLDKSHSNVVIPKLFPSNKRFFDRILYKAINVLIYISLLTPRPFSTGSSMVIAKDYFEKIDGFDPSLYIAEDHDIIRRLKKHGAKIKFMFDNPVIFSTRRFDQQGFSSYAQSIYCSLYLLVFNRIGRKLYTYEMGGDKFKD